MTSTPDWWICCPKSPIPYAPGFPWPWCGVAGAGPPVRCLGLVAQGCHGPGAEWPSVVPPVSLSVVVRILHQLFTVVRVGRDLGEFRFSARAKSSPLRVGRARG